MTTAILIYPAVDAGPEACLPRTLQAGRSFNKCARDPVEVSIKGQCAHNHVCGCTKCWKPNGALFSQIAVVPRDNLAVTKNANKLAVVDATATIPRHACKECGVHMYSRIESKEHPFYGLDFFHTELSRTRLAAAGIRRFVSSIIEAGADPPKWAPPRPAQGARPEPDDCLSPPLMDAIATHVAKARGGLTEPRVSRTLPASARAPAIEL